MTPIFLGFPPPDCAIRDVLTKFHENEAGGSKIRELMCHFLIELFEKTRYVITNNLKAVTTKSQLITEFREFMTAGQQVSGVGEKREKFYLDIAAAVKTVSHVPIQFLFLTFFRGRKQIWKPVLSR